MYIMKKIFVFGVLLACFVILTMPVVPAVQCTTTCMDAKEKTDEIYVFPDDVLEFLGELIKWLVKLIFPVTIWD